MDLIDKIQKIQQQERDLISSNGNDLDAVRFRYRCYHEEKDKLLLQFQKDMIRLAARKETINERLHEIRAETVEG